MNKVLVKLYVPMIEIQCEVWIPLNKRICNVIVLLVKSLNEFSGGYFNPTDMPILYDKLTAEAYDINLTVKETTIRNGTEIVLI